MRLHERRDRNRSKTVDKAIDLLELLVQEPEGLTLTRISQQMQENKAVTYRLLNTLVDRGLVERDPRTLHYRLGTGLLILANGVHQDVRRLALPVMQRLVEETNETAFLTAYQAGEAVCIERVNSLLPFRVNYDIGFRHPLNAAAPGKLILAFLDRTVKDHMGVWRGAHAPPVTNRETGSVSRDLEKELEQIRRRGYAFSESELQLGASGLAGPIFNDQKRLVASLGLVGPSVRWDEKTIPRYAELLLQGCREISELLGYRGLIPPR